ncbi:hypothetical protein TI03_04705 [Achromatium sp. WMS1]|nr:hypothetical protein TI03_04705 [Achromatium sp. WMS1]
MATLNLYANSEKTQETIGASLAQVVPEKCVVYLCGDLGTGKTTLVRGLLRALGHNGKVKSPTYTLLEPYQLQTRTVLHVDLYRLCSPDEFEYLGLEDVAEPNAIWLLEWPERGGNSLPPADIQIEITHQKQGRKLTITALSAIGDIVIAALQFKHIDYI